MYGDYKCLQSASVYHLIKVAQQQLNVSFGEDNLGFIFHHFPQVEIHSHAQRVAEAATAQGQFWQMHEMLFYSFYTAKQDKNFRNSAEMPR